MAKKAVEGAIKFVSKFKSHVLVIKPSYKRIQDGIVEPVPGKRIEFRSGEYVTADAAEIEFLRNHDDFGVSIFEAGPVA